MPFYVDDKAVDQEEADDELRAASGFFGTVTDVAAGVLDPTIWMPTGDEAARRAHAAFFLLRSAGNVAGVTAAQVVAREAVLLGTKETHTPGETDVSISTGALLGGLIGAGALKLLGRAERDALTETLERERAEMTAHVATAAPTRARRTIIVEEPSGPGGSYLIKTDDGSGGVGFAEKDGALKVGMASVSEACRGQGIGVAIYERALELAAEKGLVLRSDFAVSADAIRVYEGLARRGYVVMRDLRAHQHKDGGLTASHYEGSVFEVKPKPKVAAVPAEERRDAQQQLIEQGTITRAAA